MDSSYKVKQNKKKREFSYFVMTTLSSKEDTIVQNIHTTARKKNYNNTR